jgi:hypothetical protein
MVMQKNEYEEIVQLKRRLRECELALLDMFAVEKEGYYLRAAAYFHVYRPKSEASGKHLALESQVSELQH